MTSRRSRSCLLLTLALSGCLIVSPERQDQDLDPDHDDVLRWTDCDSSRDDVGEAGDLWLYVDHDGDGFGEIGERQPWPNPDCPTPENMAATESSAGWSWYSEDCDDTDPLVFPGAEEACDGVNNDCDSQIDEGGSCTVRGETALTSDTPQVRGADAATELGWALVGDVDLDGDGALDAAIASLGAGRVDGGMVHVLYGPLGETTAFNSAVVQALNTTDALGGSLTRSPDVRVLTSITLDDRALLVAGAPQVEQTAGPERGEVWLIGADRDPSAATFTPLRATLTGLSDTPEALGAALAVVTGDPASGVAGFLAIGAPDTDVASSSGTLLAAAGAVYLISTDGESLGDTTSILGQTVGDFTGAALGAVGPRAQEGDAPPGDLDGDGCADLAVGVWPSDGVGEIVLVTEACALGSGELLLEDLATARFTGSYDGDRVGSVIATSTDLTNDGYGDVLVGAPGASVGSAEESGQAWLLRGATTISSSFSTASARFVSSDTFAELGSSLCDAGDLDADGHADLALGAPGSDAIAPDAGTVWVLYGPISMSGATVDLSNEDASALKVNGVQNFGAAGHALAPAGLGPDAKGDALLIGAPGSDFGDAEDGVAVGRVFLFTPD